jgi:2-polyprenyl-3-methyl-5-hydroxy-6-metoxy-1,4-benzoquinol methylase
VRSRSDANSREATVRTFFDRPRGPRTYLEKRFGIEMRAYVTRRLLGEVIGSTILDIGCGDGTLSLQFALQQNHLTLVDLSEKMLEFARQSTPAGLGQCFEYINTDFLEYDPDQPFDVVLCVGVLAHLQSLDSTTEKLASLVKPGGRCIIQFTDQDSWAAKLDSLYTKMREAVCGNSYHYSLLKTSYTDVLHSCLRNGFEVAGLCRYSLLLPGMGRLPDRFLLRYQRLTLDSGWLSRHGSEVVMLLVKK